MHISNIYDWSVFHQSEYFEIYTQYCTNYPK